MSRILDRREWDDGEGSLALDLDCNCILIVPAERRHLADGGTITCLCEHGAAIKEGESDGK